MAPPPSSLLLRKPPRPAALRRLRRLRRLSRALLAAAAAAALLLVAAPLLHPSATVVVAAPAPVERVPPPHDPDPTEHLPPPPPDPRLPPLNDSIDPAQPLIDDNAVDSLRVVPVDASPVSAQLPPISAVVLFHNEYPTMNHTLHTWIKNDLISHVAELLFFLNGVADTDSFYNNLPVLQHTPWAAVTRVEASPQNIKLGMAIRRMVQLASHDYVLLLEKDWSLIEPPHRVATQLAIGAQLLNSSTAQVVRYRHRRYPGAPLHARIMHQNREPQMLKQQTNLYCYVHHWVQNPLPNYSQYFSQCNGTHPEQRVWCSQAKYCQWTNNPALFKRQWFLTELADRFASDFEITSQRDPKSNMLDFEFYTNWNSTVWNDRQFVVALPEGLFEHHEVGEQALMNTVWYAWNRLSTDVEEKRVDLLRTQRRLCNHTNYNASSSSSPSTTFDSGPTFEQRYPIDFVRLYHYNQSMTKTTSEALHDLSQQCDRVRKRLEEGQGTWRHAITDLTNFWYTIALYTYPTEPANMKMGFVTALFPTEHNGDEYHPQFEQSAHALASNLDVVAHAYPVVVYCSQHTRSMISDTLANQFGWQRSRIEQQVVFQVSELTDLLQRLLTTENVKRVSRLYRNETWHALSKLRSSGYVPSEHTVALSLTKPYLLDDAVQVSEQQSGDANKSNDTLGKLSHFIWMDATSKCLERVRGAMRNNDHVIRAHVMLKILSTGVKASSLDELEMALYGSGFRADQLLEEMRMAVSDGVGVADMKSLGGSKIGIRLLRGYYDAVVRDLLRNEQLGVGREALSIAVRNVEYNFNFFDGLCGCSGNEKGDHCCGAADMTATYMAEDSEDGCALFAWMSECGGGGGG